MKSAIRRVVQVTLLLASVVLATPGAIAESVARINSITVQDGAAAVTMTVSAVRSVDVQQVGATVEIGNRPVDARIFPLTSANATPAASIILVIDSSGSMASGSLAAAKVAARQFVEGLPANVKVGIVAFGDESRVLSPLSRDHDRTIRELEALTARGDTALYDGVMTALGMLDGAERQSLLLITDGADTVSSTTLDEVTATVSSMPVRLDAIVMTNRMTKSNVLNEITSAGNGDVYSTSDADGLLGIFRETAAISSAKFLLRIVLPPVGELAGNQPIRIVLRTGTSELVAVGTIALPSTGNGRAALPRALLALLALGMAVGLFIFLSLLFAGSNRARRRRIEQVIAIRNMYRGLGSGPEDQDLTLIETLERLVKPLVQRLGVEDAWTLRLDGAGLVLSAEQWFLIRVAAVVFPTVVAGAVGPKSLLMILGASAAGLAGPELFVSQRRSARAKEFEGALPDMLLLIASSLRSGFSLEQALMTAAEQSDGSAATQMKRAIQEVRIGLPLEMALNRVAERMASKDFAWVVSAVNIQRKTGGNLSELLTTAASTVRERAEIRREVQALTAEGRLSANVLMALPFIILLVLLLSQPEYVAPLWTTGLGRLLSIVGLVMLAIGWTAMQRIVKIDT